MASRLDVWKMACTPSRSAPMSARRRRSISRACTMRRSITGLLVLLVLGLLPPSPPGAHAAIDLGRKAGAGRAFSRPGEHPERGPPDALETARSKRFPPEGVVTLEGLVNVVGHDGAARIGDVDDAAGQVDRRPEVV